MQAEEIFSVWAPEASVWAAWVKPVLFTAIEKLKNEDVTPGSEAFDLSWLPRAGDTALVVNLAGAQSVRVGAALAQEGYCPVPLFNTTLNAKPVLETVSGIVVELVRSSAVLRGLMLPENAPPAFLLDCKRTEGRPVAGLYDNRWVVFPQDFPSANFLRAQGITRVLVVQPGMGVADDLSYVLDKWQSGGLTVEIQAVEADGRPGETAAYTRSRFRAFMMWTRATLIASLGLRLSSAGGFGGAVPVPGSGG